MTTLTEGTYLNDWLFWEQDNRYSRKKVTLHGDTVVGGQIAGTITASGLTAAFDQDDEASGIGTATGIFLDDYDASGGDIEAVIICRDAIVVEDQLTFPSDITAGEQITAMATLAGLGIITKEEV